MDVTLRPATMDDVEPLFAIHRAAMRGYVELTYGPWDEPWQAAFFRDHFDVSVRQVILSRGAVAGFFDLVPHADHVYVSELVIAPACQQRGIGTQLLNETQATAATRGVPVRLQVLRVNPARALYERLGFVTNGDTETHHLMEWTPQ
jgi:ribosomal protein S18 acetylase RimI-like enzyme